MPPLFPDVVAEAVVEVAAFCKCRVPPSLREQVRLEPAVRGRSVTIVELRPPWHPNLGSEWTRLQIAQLRFAEPAGWSLFWRDSSERWHRYESVPASRDLALLLAEIDSDPTGIFWG